MRALIAQKTGFSPNRLVWWIGLALSVTIGMLFYFATAKTVESDARARFQSHARNAQFTIHARIKSYTDVLRGTASLFQTTDELSHEQFHSYVAGLNLARHFPAIETINFARYLSDEERPAFEQQMRQGSGGPGSGYPAFAITPAGQRTYYSVLSYIEPLSELTDKLGIDIAAKPHVREVLTDMRDSGSLITSGQPLSAMMSGPRRTGLGIRLPIYRRNMPVTSVDQRRRAFIGSVGIAFSVNKLVQGVLDEIPLTHVRLTLVDTDAQRSGNERPVLFDSSVSDAHPAPEPAADADSNFIATLPIDFHGRLWQARFSAPKNVLYTGFDAYFPRMAMLAGFVSTMLIYALFHTLTSSRMRAIRMAKAMTKELRDSQAKLQLSHQKLRRLAAHADQIKEGERKRIAREIHDDLGQNLLALRIEADMLAQRTRARHPRLHERARMTLSQIDSTIKSVRQIINDLRPNVLDLGLNAAVDWQIAEFERRTGIVCELVENQKEIHLNDHCATAFFRILQESLSNISRHASASLVKVELQMQGERLTMTVSDNGVGLLAGGRNKTGSFGLVGIEERINILGGSFSIISSPGAGTTVCVSVPVDGEDASVKPYIEPDTVAAALPA